MRAGARITTNAAVARHSPSKPKLWNSTHGPPPMHLFVVRSGHAVDRDSCARTWARLSHKGGALYKAHNRASMSSGPTSSEGS